MDFARLQLSRGGSPKPARTWLASRHQSNADCAGRLRYSMIWHTRTETDLVQGPYSRGRSINSANPALSTKAPHISPACGQQTLIAPTQDSNE
jgi:hypothetical protein